MLNIRVKDFKRELTCSAAARFCKMGLDGGRGLWRFKELEAYLDSLTSNCKDLDAAVKSVLDIQKEEQAEYVRTGQYPAEFKLSWEFSEQLSFEKELFARFSRHIGTNMLKRGLVKIERREYGGPVKLTSPVRLRGEDVTQLVLKQPSVLFFYENGDVEALIIEFKNSDGVSNSNRVKKMEKRVANHPGLLITLLGLIAEFPDRHLSCGISFLQTGVDSNFKVHPDFVFQSVYGQGSKDDNLFPLFSKEAGYLDASGQAFDKNAIKLRLGEMISLLTETLEPTCGTCGCREICYQQKVDEQYLDASLADHPVEVLNKSYSKGQQEIIDTFTENGGKMAVIAPPGSGKTHTMVGVASRLLDKGIKADQILMVAFTTKSCEELSNRLKCGYKDIPQICTLNAFSYRTLLDHAQVVYGYDPQVCGDRQRYQLLLDILSEVGEAIEGISYRQLSFGATQNNAISNILSLFDTWKEGGIEALKEIAEKRASKTSGRRGTNKGMDIHKMESLFKRFEERLKEGHLITFEEQISDCLKMYEDHPDILKEFHKQYQWILVDEFQDMDEPSARLCFKLGSSVNLMVVGDDDQSIYGNLRGGNAKYLLKFKEVFFEDASMYVLSDNYRSDALIVDSAEKFIKKEDGPRIEKAIHPNRKSECKPKLVQISEDNYRESFISVVQDYLEKTPEVELGKVAVICTRNDTLLDIRKSFDQVGISSHLNRSLLRSDPIFVMLYTILKLIFEGVSSASKELYRVGVYYNREGMEYLPIQEGNVYKALLSYTGLPDLDDVEAYHHMDIEAECERLSKTKLGDFSWCADVLRWTTLIWDVIDNKGDSKQVIDEFARDSGLGDHVALIALQDTIEKNSAFEDPKALYYEMGSMITLADKKRLDSEYADSVVLTTAHDSKGLEWDTVFVYDVDSFSPKGKEEDIIAADRDEARRLLYVAMTRARNSLVMCHKKPEPGKASSAVFSTELLAIPEIVHLIV
jgi:DNA helicase-2/ATP-dependent DNA helicase PcrA